MLTLAELARLKRSSEFVDQCEALARAQDFDAGIVGSGLVRLGVSLMYSLPEPCDGLSGVVRQMLLQFERDIAIPNWRGGGKR